ncbi:hypothetical protein ECC02_013359 [Trypanosoma cruzi]|uniref:Uncharacterized protein n=1 Tax=Trypanosoma cruzi TaxID=5693 RepID=A0A7J6XIL3_TRYCR|nr:hypothetical protein ECC02_013359 [Trypanosoma cruzi]
MWWGLVCRPCWSLPPPSVCCSRCMTVCVCVCLLPRIGVCVVRAVRRTVHAWLLLSRLVWFALRVCLPHLSSPLLLSIFLTVQISSTPLNDHTHDDDDVPSAVRPAGARLVLLPVRMCDRECSEKQFYHHHYDYNDDDHNDYHHDYHYDDNNYNDYDHDHHYTSTNCDHDDHYTSTNCDHHYHGGAKHYDYRGANYEDHPRTATSSQN